MIIAGEAENKFFLDFLHNDLIKKYDIKNVEFVGHISGNEKWTLLGESKIFVMPSDFENFGSAIVEAFSQHLPVICTNNSPWKILREKKSIGGIIKGKPKLAKKGWK